MKKLLLALITVALMAIGASGFAQETDKKEEPIKKAEQPKKSDKKDEVDQSVDDVLMAPKINPKNKKNDEPDNKDTTYKPVEEPRKIKKTYKTKSKIILKTYKPPVDQEADKESL